MKTKRLSGWYGDKKEHALHGKQGGQKTASLHGKEFYKKIGRKGGKMSSGNFKNDPQRAKIAGKAGGLARSKKNT